MSYQWKAGDLAVCITPNGKYLRYRHIYKVQTVTPYRTWGDGYEGVGLVVEGCRNPNNRVTGNFAAKHFRPILPADPAFIEQMRRLKTKVPA